MMGRFADHLSAFLGTAVLGLLLFAATSAASTSQSGRDLVLRSHDEICPGAYTKADAPEGSFEEVNLVLEIDVAECDQGIVGESQLGEIKGYRLVKKDKCVYHREVRLLRSTGGEPTVYETQRTGEEWHEPGVYFDYRKKAFAPGEYSVKMPRFTYRAKVFKNNVYYHDAKVICEPFTYQLGTPYNGLNGP